MPESTYIPLEGSARPRCYFWQSLTGLEKSLIFLTITLSVFVFGLTIALVNSKSDAPAPTIIPPTPTSNTTPVHPTDEPSSTDAPATTPADTTTDVPTNTDAPATTEAPSSISAETDVTTNNSTSNAMEDLTTVPASPST